MYRMAEDIIYPVGIFVNFFGKFFLQDEKKSGIKGR